MFTIDDYQEGQTCLLCDKEARLLVSCQMGTMERVAMCARCLDRQCKARAGVRKAKPETGSENGRLPLPS